MQKRGQIVVIIVLAIIVVAAIIGWQLFSSFENPLANNGTVEEITTVNETPETSEANDTIKINETTGVNETETIKFTYAPDPTGTIRGIDFRNDEGKGYFCNYTKGPKHKVRLYTYKDINGKRNLSKNYIESAEIKDVCSFYPDITNESAGLYYNIKWTWKAVEGIDGYRLYQKYSYENITRDYDYYLDLPPSYTQLIDTDLDLWIWEH